MGSSNKQKRHMKAIALTSAKKRKLGHETAKSKPDSRSPIERSDRPTRLLRQLQYDKHWDMAGDKSLAWCDSEEDDDNNDNDDGEEREEEGEEEEQEMEDEEELENEEEKKEKEDEEKKSLPKLRDTLVWNDSGDKQFRQTHGKGSRSTTKRQKKKTREWEMEAKKSLSIVDVWKRAAELGLEKKHIEKGGEESLSAVVSTPLIGLRRGYTDKVNSTLNHELAVKELERLLSLKTEQIKKYGQELLPNSNFLRRHEMVLGLLRIEKRKANFPGKNHRQLATIVANVEDWGESTARSLIQWKKSWIKDRIIPVSKAGKHTHTFSWMEDEDLILDIGIFTKQSGEGLIHN